MSKVAPHNYHNLTSFNQFYATNVECSKIKFQFQFQFELSLAQYSPSLFFLVFMFVYSTQHYYILVIVF